MLNKGADHTTIAMHDQPARKPLSSGVNRVTGHSWKTVDAILQAHYLGGTTELAEAAILKYTSKFGT
jgi:hypothetical protein